MTNSSKNFKIRKYFVHTYSKNQKYKYGNNVWIRSFHLQKDWPPHASPKLKFLKEKKKKWREIVKKNSLKNYHLTDLAMRINDKLIQDKILNTYRSDFRKTVKYTKYKIKNSRRRISLYYYPVYTRFPYGYSYYDTRPFTVRNPESLIVFRDLDYEDDYEYAYNPYTDLTDEDFNLEFNYFLYEDEDVDKDEGFINEEGLIDDLDVKEEKEEKEHVLLDEKTRHTLTKFIKEKVYRRYEDKDRHAFNDKWRQEYAMLRIPGYKLYLQRERKKIITNYNFPTTKFITSNFNFIKAS